MNTLLKTMALLSLALVAGCSKSSHSGGGSNTITITTDLNPVPFCGTANFGFSTEWGNATFTPPSGNPLPVLMWNDGVLPFNPDQALTDLNRPIEGGLWRVDAEHDGKTGSLTFNVDALKLAITERPTTFGDLTVSYQTPNPGTLQVFRNNVEVDSASVDNTATVTSFQLDQSELFLPKNFLVQITVDGKRQEQSFATLGSTLGIYIGPLTQGIVMTPSAGGYDGFFRLWVGHTIPGEELLDPDHVPGQPLIAGAPVRVVLRVGGQDIVLDDVVQFPGLSQTGISGFTNAVGEYSFYFSLPEQVIHDLLPASYDPFAGQQPPRSLIVTAWSSLNDFMLGGEVTQEYDLSVLADELHVDSVPNNHWGVPKSTCPTLRYPKASNRWTPIEFTPFVIGTELQGFQPDNSDISPIPGYNKICIQEVVWVSASNSWEPKGIIMHETISYDTELHRWVTNPLVLPSGRYAAWSFVRELPTLHAVGGNGVWFYVRSSN